MLSKQFPNHRSLLPKVEKIPDIPDLGCSLTWYPYTQYNYFVESNGVKTTFKYLPNDRKMPKDIRHIYSSVGNFYLLDATKYLQHLSGIYPLHQDPDTQNWLIECVRQRLNKTIAFCDVISLRYEARQPLHTKDWVVFSMRSKDQPSDISMAGQANFFIHYFKHIQAKRLQKPTVSADLIELSLPIWVGHTKVLYYQYCKIGVGDIIRLHNSHFNIEGEGRRAVGDFVLKMQYQDDALIFQEWEQNTMPYDKDMDYTEGEEEIQALAEDDEIPDLVFDDIDEDQNADFAPDDVENTSLEDASAKPHPFANLEVSLDFSLGQLRMNIEQITQLAQGSVIPLKQPLPAQVTIYANKKAIAMGEMVAIDQQLGVRIVDILKRS